MLAWGMWCPLGSRDNVSAVISHGTGATGEWLLLSCTLVSIAVEATDSIDHRQLCLSSSVWLAGTRKLSGTQYAGIGPRETYPVD
jgi:hypothetical protein